MTSESDRSRRDVLILGAATALVGAGLAGPAAAELKTVVYNNSGGASADAARAAWGGLMRDRASSNLLVTAPASVARLKAMIQARNVEWDVAELVSQEHKQAIRESMLQKLDLSVIDLSHTPDDCKDEYSVVYALYSTAMAYSSKIAAAKRPGSWAEFWDVAKFPGRRALRNHPVDNLEFALLADGVPKDKIYPIDFDRAFASLDRIKKHIAVWWRDGSQPAQMLIDGEVDFTSGWHGRFFALAQKGETGFGVQWNQAMLKRSWVGVPQGAKNPREAMQLISFMIDPTASAKYAEGIGYICCDARANNHLPENVRPWVMSNPAIAELTVSANEQWWLDNGELAQRKWNDWIVT
ncbi:hypothetical protein ABB55_14425 [Prosthecomicrobium hirschii]|uniref:ABC transporter substrate-binding protein n=1 Tax=Prosthecodimorpha hirschii TaxID=665126 RepID=A0A0P6VKQ4_9HYPH|nr:ABC transporter substrate-binding protein [Prosthecomicrobium hirschii]KPL53260.1 hypothetical protein ABB55_14425 [Prosthecomicrobium hirschii]